MNNPVLEYFKSNIGKSALEAGTPSPYGRWLNGTLIAAEEGELTVEVIVRKDMCNPGGFYTGAWLRG